MKTIVLDIDPSTLATAQQKGIHVIHGHAMVYTKTHIRKIAEQLRCALEKVRGGFFVPSPYPCRVSVDFFFPHTKDTRKSIACKTIRMTKRPDTDNLLKGLIDAMSPKYKKVGGKRVRVSVGYWDDDSQICFGHVDKWRTPGNPRIEITLQRLEILEEYQPLPNPYPTVD